MVYYDPVDNRVLILSVPSLVILGLLVFHSLRTLPRSRAVAFWFSVLAYGILRGVALRWVIDHGLGASFPYAIRNPLFTVFHVPAQEIAGWAIVVYIGWWLGSRFSPKLFPQIAWACVFLGAISWAVESAAIAAGWWHWTVPVTQPLFMNVPFIAIVDWFFVGTDFLLPFAVLTAPELRGRPARFVTLLAFPVHFAAHCFSDRSAGGIPIPVHHLAHWIVLATLVWIAMRFATVDTPFAGDGSKRGHAWMPLTGLAIMLIDAAAVELLMAREPRLLLSILPALTMTIQTLSPAAGYAAGAVGLVLGAWLAPFLVAAVPAAASGLLGWGGRQRRWVPLTTLAVLGLVAVQVHSAGARKQDDLIRRLDVALAARDRGDLDVAKRELAALCGEYPGSHVPPALLGQIDYRTDSLEDASRRFASAVEIKHDYTEGFRYLAVIELRQGRNQTAARFAQRGLAVDQDDPDLLYLAARAEGLHGIGDRFERLEPPRAYALASLAFEIGDTEGAVAMLDRGLALWPDHRSFYSGRVKLALQQGDTTVARHVVAAWRGRYPQDPEAHLLSKQLGME